MLNWKAKPLELLLPPCSIHPCYHMEKATLMMYNFFLVLDVCRVLLLFTFVKILGSILLALCVCDIHIIFTLKCLLLIAMSLCIRSGLYLFATKHIIYWYYLTCHRNFILNCQSYVFVAMIKCNRYCNAFVALLLSIL